MVLPQPIVGGKIKAWDFGQMLIIKLCTSLPFIAELIRALEQEFDRLVEASQNLQALPLFIDQTGGISLAQLAARARRLKRQKNLGLVIVDYLQLLSGSSRRASEGRVQEVTEITTGLKALAKELNVPIIALSQLSRQVENRDDKRPQLADLRESGSIEQDADVVMFLYRPEVYNKDDPSLEGRAELIVGKQRNGPIGTVQLNFIRQFTRFVNPEFREFQ